MSTPPQPVVQQHAATPPGNIPKGRQTYIMIGVAVVIVASIVFSGAATNKTAKPGTNLPSLTVATPSKRDIDTYSQQLKAAEQQEKQAQEQAARQKELLRQVTEQGGVPATDARMQGGIPGQAVIGPDGRPYYSMPVQSQSQPLPSNPVVQEKEKLEASSLFASPVALSLRPTTTAISSAPIAVTANPTVSPAATATLIPNTPPVTATNPPVSVASEVSAVSRVPQHILFEGTILEAVLTNRLAGTFSGPVNCMVTTNVYSHDRNLLLIPQGSRVLGEAKRVAEQQQQRLAVSFHRLIMPDGFSVNLDQFSGLSQEGATGLKDETNNHYLEVFGTSIALGIMSGFSQFGTGSALTSGGFDSYRQGVAGQLAQNSSTVLSRQLNRLPDITIREGQRIKIILTKDLALPAYAGHSTKEDL